MKFSIFFCILLGYISGIQVIGQDSNLESKIYGMLIGSAIGDAAGGPVEFVSPPQRSYWCVSDKAVTTDGIKELAGAFKLRNYPKIAEPYAQFVPFAPEGSVTDDTRWKIILFNSIKEHGNYLPVSQASSFWNFRNTLSVEYDSICNLWQQEYGYVMNFYLDRQPNFPPERVWGGIPTMAGQMPYLVISAFYPENPDAAYRAAWEANILDVGYAKDITSIIVAGLAEALSQNSSWNTIDKVMRNTDPYKFAEVPWVPRKSTYWITKADELVSRSSGVISVLFKLLEAELDAVTWWEAHVPLCVSLSFLKIVDYDPLAALQLCLEFGHDTDSYAQVVGAFAGAMYGKEIFSEELIDKVNSRMKEQYNQNVDDWMEIITNSIYLPAE
ncbi:ADP-ribosylglycohydrolase family protein [Bacteroidota bacterium]